MEKLWGKINPTDFARRAVVLHRDGDAGKPRRRRIRMGMAGGDEDLYCYTP